MNPAHVLPSCLYKILFSILPPKGLSSDIFFSPPPPLTKDLYYFFPFPHMCQIPRLFHRHLFVHKRVHNHKAPKWEQEIQISTRHSTLCCKVYILICIEYHWFCETSVIRGRCALETSWGIQVLPGMAFGLKEMFYQTAGVRPQWLILLLNFERPFPCTSAWKWLP
jgi:hypothetical protein